MDKPIGIFGGTFDPVHFGHLRSALDIQQILDFHEVRFIPCKLPVHKEANIATAQQRYAMLLLATENVPSFVVDDCEIMREGPSYMFDTLCALKANYPNRPLCLMLGTDAFMQLPTWHRWKQLLDYAHIVIMQRPGTRLHCEPALEHLMGNCLADDISELHEAAFGKIYFQLITEMAISATQIRAQMQAGLKPHFLLPANVLHFIQQNKLYQNSPI